MTTPEVPTAVKTSSAFSMECSVRCSIRAGADRIWKLLTDGPRFPEWNSTVTRIDGAIAPGATLKLHVPSAPGRVFKPKVSAFDPGRSMVWSDGMAPMFKGVRTFTLTPGTDGTTLFAMTERFSGLMLPMIKGSLPDFGPIFETYARDLKRAAEAS
ncbi:MAG TPA: SRPBCC domain-containing protein [Polyangiaceae bacterium]